MLIVAFPQPFTEPHMAIKYSAFYHFEAYAKVFWKLTRWHRTTEEFGVFRALAFAEFTEYARSSCWSTGLFGYSGS